jgi:hypothetical protein
MPPAADPSPGCDAERASARANVNLGNQKNSHKLLNKLALEGIALTSFSDVVFWVFGGFWGVAGGFLGDLLDFWDFRNFVPSNVGDYTE